MTLLGLKSTIINHEKKISGHSLWEVGLSSGSFRASLGRHTHFSSGLSLTGPKICPKNIDRHLQILPPKFKHISHNEHTQYHETKKIGKQ